jgi:hypothetical protein
MTRFGLADLHTHHPMGSTDALLPSEYVERLGARMRMHGRNAARRATSFVDPQEILRGNHLGEWSNFGNLGAAR